jgi:hypothetical protein
MAMEDVAGASSSSAAAASDPTHGWQTVSYPKRHRKQAHQPPRAMAPDLALQANGKGSGVFDAVEKRSQERHRALQQQLASRAADLDDARIAPVTGGAYSDDSDSDEATAPRQVGEVKKPKKPKKPKVTVAEAAALIDAENLAAHLVEISVTPHQNLSSPSSSCLKIRSWVDGPDRRFCPFLRDRIWIGFSNGSCWTS